MRILKNPILAPLLRASLLGLLIGLPSGTAGQEVSISGQVRPRVELHATQTTPTSELRVDTRRERYSARQLEERAISLAASIIHAADLSGFEIGLSLPGTDQPTLLTRRGHWHRARVMSAMAAIDLDAPREGSGPLPTSHGERAAQIVIHPDRVEPSIGREDALHLSARAMSRLTVRSIGWDAGASPLDTPDTPDTPDTGPNTAVAETAA